MQLLGDAAPTAKRRPIAAFAFLKEDMLDLVEEQGLRTPTSRLGCQVRLTDALQGATVRLPSEFVDCRGNQ